MQMDRRQNGSHQTGAATASQMAHSRNRSIPSLYGMAQSNPTSPVTPSSPLASVDMLVNQSTGFHPSHGRNRSLGGGVLSPVGSNGPNLGSENEWADIQARSACRPMLSLEVKADDAGRFADGMTPLHRESRRYTDHLGSTQS